MAKFFTSPKDLARWVKEANSSYQEASQKIMIALGSNKNEQDIIETTKRIFSNNNVEEASSVLFSVLANYNITEENVKKAESKCNNAITADALEKYQVITAEEKGKIIKEAQIMRQPGEYPMRLKRCPKLPFSVGKGLISTYNCRHYCLDSLVFDEDPDRVYCAEALWRGHVMDKFSREWEDAKTGELVGGYINNRFYVFPDGGTPANPDVPRYHGNRMSLKPWERSRIPRKHEWSVERRLSEQREPNSTKSITLSSVITGSKNMVKLASADGIKKDKIASIFSEAIDLHNNGVLSDDAALKLSDKYNHPVEQVVAIQAIAIKKMAVHQADVYKTAAEAGFFTLPQGEKARGVVNGSMQEIGSEFLLKPYGMVNNDYQGFRSPVDQSPVIIRNLEINRANLLPFNEANWNEINQGFVDSGNTQEESSKDLMMGETALPGKTSPAVAPAAAEAPAQP